MKINLFSFSGPLATARYLQRKLTELMGNQVTCKESSLELSETEELATGEIRLILPTRLIPSLTDLLKTMESGEYALRDLLKEYKTWSYLNLSIIYHRSVVCPPPCQYGYIMVRGNACQCYDCKGTGYIYPKVGSYELRRIDKKEASFYC